MSSVLEIYQYSVLANAAYMELDDYGETIEDENILEEAVKSNVIPTSLGEKTFLSDPESNPSVWQIPPNGYHSDTETGYAATLFERDGEKVLAIRGTGKRGQYPFSIFDYPNLTGPFLHALPHAPETTLLPARHTGPCHPAGEQPLSGLLL